MSLGKSVLLGEKQGEQRKIGRMKMPEKIEGRLFAVCGMNCMVCYSHLKTKKYGKACRGCLFDDESKPQHCRKCSIMNCCRSKGYSRCHECAEFPCKILKRLEKAYQTKYGVSLLEQSRKVQESGIDAFMEAEKERWICKQCGGVISLHDSFCSDCLKTTYGI